METGTARASIDPESAERFTALRRQLGVSAFGINQLNLAPGERGRIHRHHRQEEVYLVLAGTLTVLVENEPHELRHGDLLRVAPELKRQLVNYGPEGVVLIALGGDGEHQGRDGEAFAEWDQATGASPQEVPLPPDLEPDELRAQKLSDGA